MANTKRVLRSRKAKSPTPTIAPGKARTKSAAPNPAPTTAFVAPVQDMNIGVARNPRGSSSLSAPPSDIGEPPSAPVSPQGTMTRPEQASSKGSKMNVKEDPQKDSNKAETSSSAPTAAETTDATDSERSGKRQRTLTKKAQDIEKAKKSVDKPSSAAPTGVRKSKRVRAASAKPSTSNEKPTSTVSKTTSSNNKPIAAASKLTAIIEESAATASKASSSNEKPTGTTSKSSSSNAKPTTNCSKSTTSHPKTNATTSTQIAAAPTRKIARPKYLAAAPTKQAVTYKKQPAPTTEQAASSSVPNPSRTTAGFISDDFDGGDEDEPPAPAAEAHLSRAEKIALTKKRFNYNFDMSPWIEAAKQGTHTITSTVRYPTYKRGGRFHGETDQFFHLALKMRTDDGKTRIVWHAPPYDWSDDRAIETLNSWLSQKFTRVTGARVRATPVAFEREEREFILAEYEAYPRATVGINGSIADAMNRRFEGQMLANGVGPRPRRTAASITSEIGKHRADYSAGVVPVPKKKGPVAGADKGKGKKRAAEPVDADAVAGADPASMPPPSKKQKPAADAGTTTTATSTATAAGPSSSSSAARPATTTTTAAHPSNDPLHSPSLTTRALALFFAATNRSPAATLGHDHPTTAPLSAEQYNALLAQTHASMEARKRAHAAEVNALNARNADLYARNQVLQTSLEGQRTYYRRRIQALEGRGAEVGSTEHRDLEGGLEEREVWRRQMEGEEEDEDVEMSEEEEEEEEEE